MATEAVAGVEDTDSNTNKKMHITLRSGGTLTHPNPVSLEVSSSETVASLHARLATIRGVPPARHRLILQTYTLPAEPSRRSNTPNSTAMAAAETGSNTDKKKMQIFVVLPRPGNIFNPNTIAIEVSSTDTVAGLKARLEDVDGENRRIPAWRQRLVVAGSALPDDGFMTLAELGLGDSSTVQLVETRMHVSVHGYGSSVRHICNLSSTDTVDTIKARYEAMEGVPVDWQRLTLNPNWVDLKNGRTLADYGVQDMSSLNYRRLRWDQTDAFMALGRVMTMVVRSSDTVGHVKRAVKAKVGVPVAAQRAYHYSVEVDNLEDGRTMEELGIMVRESYAIDPPQLRIECRREEEAAGGAVEEAEGHDLGPCHCRLFKGDLRKYYKSQARKHLAWEKRQAARKEEGLPYWRPPVRMPRRILHVFLEAPDPLLPK